MSIKSRRTTALVGLVVAAVLVAVGLDVDSREVPAASRESTQSVHLAGTGSRVVIPDLRINAPLSEKPSMPQWDQFLRATVRSFGVPDDMTSVVRWSDGPNFSEPGMAVLLGHTQPGGPGVFNSLGAIPVGARVEVIDHDRVHLYRVSGRSLRISKHDPRALTSALTEQRDVADLALITCDGPFDSAAGASTENSIVFAEKYS